MHLMSTTHTAVTMNFTYTQRGVQLRPAAIFLSQGLLAFLLIVQVSLAGETKDKLAEEHLQRAQRAGSLDEQIEHYLQAVKYDSTSQPAIYNLGVCYFRKGDFERSISFLTRVPLVYARHVRSYLRTAYTFQARRALAERSFEAAIEASRQAVRLDSTDASAYAVMGSAQFAQMEIDGALHALQRAVRLDPDLELAWLTLGDVLMMKLEFEKAVRAYSAVLALNPFSRRAQEQRQRAMDKLGFHRPPASPKNETASFGKSESGGKPELPVITTSDREFYHAGVMALAARRWQKALVMFQRVSPEFEDVQLKLEEARSELVLARNARSSAAKADMPAEGEAATIQSKMDDTVVVTSGDSRGEDDLIISSGLGRPGTTRGHIKKVTSRKIKQNNIRTRGFVWSSYVLSALGLALLFRRLRRLAENGAQIESVRQQMLASRNPCSPTPGTSERSVAAEAIDLATPSNIFHPGVDMPESERTFDPKLCQTGALCTIPKSAKRIGRYYITSEIGAGSMGMVYKAWDPLLERTVVIKKVVLTAFGPKPSLMRDRLYREASAAGKLNHPNIVTIHDVGEEKEFSYIVMEYLRGQTLRELMDSTGPLGIERATAIVRQVCQALEFAHRHGIVHRDVKPANIIIVPPETVKVADFGIAQLPKRETLSHAGDVMGTPFYMSPEQIEGRRLDGRSDIFSTGVLLYEMVTGCRPFEGENVPEIVYKIVYQPLVKPTKRNPALPGFLDALIERALAKDADSRYQSALEFGHMLDEMKEDLLIT